MKLAKARLSPLDRVCKVLDACGVTYMRANMTARDEETKKEIQTTVIMFGAAFGKDTGEFLFPCPVVNPMAGTNHQSS